MDLKLGDNKKENKRYKDGRYQTREPLLEENIVYVLGNWNKGGWNKKELRFENVGNLPVSLSLLLRGDKARTL